MGLLNKFIVLYFFTAIYLYVGGVQTPFTALSTGTIGWDAVINTTFSLANIASFALIVATSVLSGGISTIALLAPLCIFLASFFTFPLTLFNAGGLPPELVGTDAAPGFLRLIYYALNFLFGLAVANWFKGSE